VYASTDSFWRRHIGPNEQTDVPAMLKVVKADSIAQLVSETVPAAIRCPPMQMRGQRSEYELLAEFRNMMGENKILRSFIGAGYHDTITPPVILRNILENPLWYTAYTPYQAEIAQGRMEMLLNYQTMITDLTGMPMSNASLLDEATAAAEAMYMAFQNASRKKSTFLVSDDVHPQTLAVVRTRATAIGVKVVVQSWDKFDFSSGDVCGALVQYPNTHGVVSQFGDLPKRTHDAGGLLIVAADLLSLTVLSPPGEWGADVVVGSAQRFGVPMGFGGPHAAFMAVAEEHKRKMPGRVIGISKDSRGLPALRMAMQTREQHIRRDKATSNICTAQALLANTAVAYAIYHGPTGLKNIATRIHRMTQILSKGLSSIGVKVVNSSYFDTLQLSIPNAAAVVAAAEAAGMNLRLVNANTININLDETVSEQDITNLLAVFGNATKAKSIPTTAQLASAANGDLNVPAALVRKSGYLSHPVFNSYHSETEMLRYMHKLASKDLSLATAMIPLGSCTMKLNATSEMIPVTWPTVGGLHPFAPKNQTLGYDKMMKGLIEDLCKCTGFAGLSLQPNAGSQGEFAGLLVLRAYHESRNEAHRNICLIPTSAHGTNPASAVLAGFKIVVVDCDAKGNIDVADLKKKAELHSKNLAALMVTYPSTHGVFESSISDICKIVHQNGGQVYMDGANMNAQVGLTSPAMIGADVCHLNLHKTFCIPHGGGGPGMGPIGVAKHLVPFLPRNPWESGNDHKNAVGAVAAAPFSSASILPISWMYIRMMGGEGLTKATEYALLNANYMAERLAPYYQILYRGEGKGRVAHEFIIDLRMFKAQCGVTEEDVAKRLMDYNFHAPTMSFPVAGTLMVEPTESESKAEMDRFIDAMINIRKEIADVESGKVDKLQNVLKGAPHTADAVLSDSWNRPYPREQAAYPLPYLRQSKFWPTVGRIDNVFGDRNLICTCAPISDYIEQPKL
jgi:glycine dehydrogenase